MLLGIAIAINNQTKNHKSNIDRRCNTMNSTNKTATEEDKVYYPRTGKRGVPQQFPRKLYEMLEFEAGSYSVDWVATGRGFSITDVDHFSESVLPRWFKTSKFSSFQRNLNLYGFTKSRKGLSTVYFHPKFCKDDLEGLSHIRKRESPNKKKEIQAGLCPRANAPFMNKPVSNVPLKPVVENHIHYPLSPTSSGRLDLLTEAMKLVIQGETKLYTTSSEWNSQTCLY